MPKNYPSGLVAALEDETSQSRLFEALKESEHHYHQLIQRLPAAIYTCDAQGRILFYNKAAATLWGREPKIGKDLWCGSWRIYKTDGSPLALDSCPMAIALKEKRPITGEEIVIERPDHFRRNVLPHPQPLFDGQGKVIGAVNMLVDITDLKNAEQALRESEERFRTMADQAPIIIWMSDDSGNTIYVNTRWCEFTGVQAEKGFHRGWIDFIHPDDKENVYVEWQNAFLSKHSYHSKFRYRNSINEYRIINANFSPRFGERDEFMGYIGMFTDITLQENTNTILENLVQQRTRDLLQSNTDLERSNMELEQFAYVATHDLQEPLRKIQAFCGLLVKDINGNMSDRSKMYLEKITGSANRLSNLIDDLLNFSRLTNQSPAFTEINLNDIFSKVINDFEFEINSKNAIIKIDHLPVIEAIPLQMNQLFHNLISNSLKFVKKDKQPMIRVTCRKLMQKETIAFPKLLSKRSYYEIKVSDNGIGFEKQYAEQIFMIFQRLHEQYFYAGSGIGLALCKKIVTNHQGKIYAKGSIGQGASFITILPEKQYKLKSTIAKDSLINF